jgi:DsbC/DsbD-like thiol-disulfide interchange protein
MIIPIKSSGLAAVAAGPLLVLALVSPAGAADASAWDGDGRSAVRLLAGGSARSRADGLRAGLEIRLSPGWKTYWRYPGDSGVPPVIDFSKSENVKSVTVSWPAPHRFMDDGGTSIGYKVGVVLPLQVVPQNPARPVTLRAAVDYAICERICIPAKSNTSIALSSAPSTFDAALRGAEAQVPKPAALGQSAPFGILGLRREPYSPHERVVVDVAAASAAALDLFVEGPTGDWALPVPEPIDSPSPGVHRFAFELDGMPPGASAAGARLRLTLVSGTDAIEVTTVLQ